jgi:hypothetical protein
MPVKEALKPSDLELNKNEIQANFRHFIQLMTEGNQTDFDRQ